MKNFIDKNQSIKKKKHDKEIQMLQKSDLRHSRNIYEEFKKNELKADENEEKIFQKYISFYYCRKNKEKENKLKISKRIKIEMDKSEKLEELNVEKNKKTEELIKKLKDIDQKKAELIHQKNDELKNINKRRNEYIKTCYENKKKLLEDFSEARAEILDNEIQVLNRGLTFYKANALTKTNLTEKTILDQQNLEKNLKPFYKRLEMIKSKSIQKKPIEEYRKLYKKKKREEAEAKKKEKEEQILGIGSNS